MRPLTSEALPRAYASYYTHKQEHHGEIGRGLKGWLRHQYVASRFRQDSSALARFGAVAYRLAGGNWQETDAAYRFVPPAPARVLDYGCGSGAYLKSLKQLGYDVTGVDFDAHSIALSRASGLRAFALDELPREEWHGRFDAITLGHVIEHVHDPASLLADLRGWLAEGGMVFIEAPNAQATGLDLFGKYWRGLEAPRHLAIPTIAGLEAILARAGLQITHRAVRRSVRPWMWDESLQAMPESVRQKTLLAARNAPKLAAENAEFLTVVARPVPS